MATPRYYRQQAKTLLSLAIATDDHVYAANLTVRAMKLLATANQVQPDAEPDLAFPANWMPAKC